MQAQTTADVLAAARATLDSLGLSDWSVKINNRFELTLGRCNYAKHQIELGGDFVRLNPLDVIDQTVRHEAAHAAIGPGNGHGPVWRMKAREFGVKNPRARTTIKIQDIVRYVATCPGCGFRFERETRPRKRRSCWFCSNGKFNYDYMLEYRRIVERG